MRSVTIEEWLATEGLSQYAELFGQQRIALDVLSDLTDRELQDLGNSSGRPQATAERDSVLGENSAAESAGASQTRMLCSEPRCFLRARLAMKVRS